MADFGMKYLPELPADADKNLRDAYNKIREVTTYIQERLKLTNKDSKSTSSTTSKEITTITDDIESIELSLSDLTDQFNSGFGLKMTVVTGSRSLSIGPNELVFGHSVGSVPSIVTNQLPTNPDYTYGVLVGKTASNFTVSVFASSAASQTLTFLVG